MVCCMEKKWSAVKRKVLDKVLPLPHLFGIAHRPSIEENDFDLVYALKLA